MFPRMPVFAALIAATSPALPAVAQTGPDENSPGQLRDGPACGGQPAPWIGGDRAGSDIGTAGGPVVLGMTSTAEDSPYAVFTISGEATAIRLEARSTGDPMLRLQTLDGDLIDENDDAPGTLNSRIETTLASGDYCVQLVPVGDPAMMAEVQLSTPAMAPLLAPQDDMAGGASGAIAPCTPGTEAVQLAEGPLEPVLPLRAETGGVLSYHRFTLGEPAGLTLRAESETLDPHMALFDATGRQIGANDDADGLNARLDFPSPLAAGDYCLGVAPLSDGEGVITVSAEALDRDSFLTAAYHRGEIAPPLGGDHPMLTLELPRDRETVVLHDGTAQWMRFGLDRQTMLVVSAHGALTGIDTKLALFGPTGAVLAANDDSGETTDSRLGPVLLEPGQYRLALTDIAGMGGPAGRPGAIRPVTLVFERFLRADE